MTRFLGGLVLFAVALLPTWELHSPAREPPVVGNASQPAPSAVGHMQVTADWFNFIFGGQSSGARPEGPRLRPDNGPKTTAETYRTLCVRLCDGFYFPLSYATTPERFAGDAQQCEKRCPARSRLFVHRHPGEEVEDMRDLDGRPYRALPTALLYRTQYIADCTCGGNPWDEVSVARHRAYAPSRQRLLKRGRDKP